MAEHKVQKPMTSILRSSDTGDHHPESTAVNDVQRSTTEQNEGGDDDDVSGEGRDTATTGMSEFVTSDGGWGWIVVFGSFMVHLLTDGITYAFGVFTPDIVEYYSVSRQTVGWLNSVLVSVTFVSGPIASKLCEIFGYRAVTMLGGVLGGIGFVVVFFYSNIVVLFMTSSILAGFGFGLAYLPSICVVSEYFEKKRALAIGLAVCGSGIGTLIFGSLIIILRNLYTWRGSMLIIGALMLNSCVCGAVYRPRAKKRIQTTVFNSINIVTPNRESCKSFLEANSSRNCVDSYDESSEHVHRFAFSEHVASSSNLDSLTISNQERGEGIQLVQRRRNVDFDVSRLTSSAISPSQALSLSLILYNRRCIGSVQMSTPFSYQAIENVNNASARASSRRPIFARFCNSLIDIFNPYLLKNVTFQMFAVSNFLTNLGFNAPFLFVADRAILQGIDAKSASFLIATIGIGNTLGRVIFSALATKANGTFRLHLYNASLTICGIITVASCWATTYPLMIMYTLGFGLFSGAYVCLTPVVLVDLLGIECLGDSFGLTLLFMGLAVFVGPPLAGAIFDMTGSYDFSFAVCGACIFASGAMMYPLLFMTWKKPSKSAPSS